ncbi:MULTISPECIES: hypothetical protein [unclassified Streptomyces]|uniref:hypothetical protein n=1 Tax=unclassified Streptomyces TaxID=2593676 RepID=UPI00225C4117|nr:hypothetical protein [Streptomyces sp. NBC_01264]MCX4783958.1 hypothetical protein [Streptomyces sp. NBC_01264]
MWHSRRERRPVDEADEVERRIRAFIKELELPPVDSVLELLPFMAERMQRDIQLMPFVPDRSDPDALDPSSPCGVLMSTDDTDFLFFDNGVSPAYSEITAGHEFAHMLLHRDRKSSLSVENLGGLITDIDPSTVRLVLGRSRFTEPDEFEAEMFGTLLQEHVSASRAAVSRRTSQESDPIARTLLR